MKILVVIDMQNDFVTGSLGTPEARAIVPRVLSHVKKCAEDGTEVFFTRDTHTDDYLNTAEGKKLPVPHCIYDTEGWQIIPELRDIYAAEFGDNLIPINKPTFGSTRLAEELLWISQNMVDSDDVLEIELCGVCTDICVVSNALMLKAFMPEAKISVRELLCAGTSVDAHRKALDTMRSCQIDVI